MVANANLRPVSLKLCSQPPLALPERPTSLVTADRPDLVVLDLGLPGVSGTEGRRR